MRIGIFADTHDHLDHIRLAVEVLNSLECELVVFAGDFVSTIAVPPLRALKCPMLACFGDNEGNKSGLHGGMRMVGKLAEPPLGFRTPDGKRVLVTHQLQLLRKDYEGADIIIYGHTHRAKIVHDEAGRLFINPGETSGWTYRNPSVALLETTTMQAQSIPLLATPQVAGSSPAAAGLSASSGKLVGTGPSESAADEVPLPTAPLPEENLADGTS